MNHTIEKMKYPLEYLDDNRKPVSMNGYAFINKSGGTIIIVYGEGRKDGMSKYLNEDGDLLNIKYKIISL